MKLFNSEWSYILKATLWAFALWMVFHFISFKLPLYGIALGLSGLLLFRCVGLFKTVQQLKRN